MWQSSISAEGSDEFILQQIGKDLMPLVDRFGGIVLCDKISDRARLSVAVGDRHADELKERLESSLADAIGQHYKERFLKDEITLKGLPECFVRAYIQALVSFDRNYEQQVIKNLIPDSDSLSLDGILRFRCDELKTRWREIAELAMETAACSVNRQVCLELIKFLVTTMDPVVDIAKVTNVGDDFCIELCGCGKSETVKTDAVDLCAQLIKNLARRVEFCTEQNNQEIKLAKEIFDFCL